MTARFDITDEVFMSLQDCGLQGMSLAEAGKVIGVHNKSIVRAAIRQNLASWLVDLFPTCKIDVEGAGRHIEIRTLKPDQIHVPLDIDMDSIYVRSAAMAWRKIA